MARRNIKDWYRSKTLWIAVGQGVLGVFIALIAEYPEFGGLLIAKSVLDVGLRIVTEQPIK